MPRFIAVLAITSASMLPLTGSVHVSQGATIDQAQWLTGCWSRSSGTRRTDENWMQPAGGVMMGASRTVRDGKVAEYEFIRLFERDGRLVYQAMPSRQATTEFTSVSVNDSSLTFENLAHDFPQRIVYRRHSPRSMTATIEGPGPNGTRRIDFPFLRVSCEGTEPH